jgi:UDP-glucuronate decarboxylase
VYLRPLVPRKQFKHIPPRDYPAVRVLPASMRRRILVTGGAGFVGSHLVDRLMLMGHEVTVVDNFFTGSKRNVAHWLGHPHFELVRHDIIDHFAIEVDQIYHLACPASPPHYQYNPIKTVKTSVLGTINMLGLAKRIKARLLFTSTSEVYGDPDVHPQPESYFGNVNCGSLFSISCFLLLLTPSLPEPRPQSQEAERARDRHRAPGLL